MQRSAPDLQLLLADLLPDLEDDSPKQRKPVAAGFGLATTTWTGLSQSQRDLDESYLGSLAFFEDNTPSPSSKQRRPVKAGSGSPTNSYELSRSRNHAKGSYLDLAPSVGPTPRWHCPTVSKQTAYLLAPSGGQNNNRTRSQNMGTPLNAQKLRPASSSGKRLSRVNSAPMTVYDSSSRPSSAPATLAAMTPRGQRGVVRKLSHVMITYPLEGKPQPRKPRPPRPSSAPTRPASPSSPSSPSSPGKRVSFADDGEGLYRQELSMGKQRSMKLMGSLWDLRRVGTCPDLSALSEGDSADMDPDVSKPDGNAMEMSALRRKKQKEKEEEDILHGTLRDLEDTEIQLHELELQLSGLQESVVGHGGSRHATSVIYGRSYQVVRRKRELVQKATWRLEAFEAAHAQREDVCKNVVSGTAEPPHALIGIKKFIAANTHSGNLMEANKSDFDSFASSFKLPSEHSALENIRTKSAEICAWWVARTVEEAETGISLDAIARVIDVSVGSGAKRDHPDLIKALIIGAKTVKARFAKFDAKQTDKMGPPPIGQANMAADAIEAILKKQMAEISGGAGQLMTEATTIIKDLREMEGQWKRLAGRQARLNATKPVSKDNPTKTSGGARLGSAR